MSVPEGYKSLGKIGISYKGDYNSNTAYERLDAVFHNGSTYLAIKDAPDGAPRDDKTNWIYLAKGYDGETVDVADSEIAFTDSETRENISTGEKVSTVFGKIKKFFADLAAPAFAQMITTKEDLLATKVTGYVPDAKAVADTYTELNRNLSVRYNADTDTIQVCYNDQWIDWEAARIQATVLFDGIAGTGLATDLITGFTQINASYGTSYSVSSEHITMSGTGNNTSGTIQPRFRSANTIDITSYSKLIIECESVFNSGAPAVGFTADASKKPSTGNIITLSIGTNELDISGLSGAYYLLFDGVTNTNGTAKIRKISLK